MHPVQRTRPSAGDIVSRVIFGGFWTLVTLAAFGLSMAAFSEGKGGGGFALLVISVLTGLYAVYIFRGGRFRFLFW